MNIRCVCSLERLSLVKQLTVLVSTSDTIALSFGFASTFVAIVTIFVTRRAYLIPSSPPISLLFLVRIVLCINGQADWFSATTDLERRPNTSNVSGLQMQEEMLMEEMRLRRWATVKKSAFEK
jgi:hypothetical protein